MAKYVAFLRGINVGGHKAIKMEKLKKTFDAMGFANVKTLLASGNVLFETQKSNERSIAREIESTLAGTFGHQIGVLIRAVVGLQKLENKGPFSGIEVTPQIRLYVTFISEKPENNLEIPYESPDGNFKIISATSDEVLSVVTLSPGSRTVDLMKILEKKLGKKVTTRNWNTIQRILKAAQAG
jgi:uncharacterized protein (DUF1697 family)